jgi:hypothetical protein
VFECGCEDIPDGECDCDGNVLDVLGECGGDCDADEDADGICDDVDPCVGALDECGVCNGPGAVFECGCEDVPEGDCDCDGNVLDVLGECGGDCDADEDADGVCDDEDPCVGALDECGVCNGPGAVFECGCEDIPDGECDCDGNVLDVLGECGGDCEGDADGDGVCDSEEVIGCMDELACNYNPLATDENGLCTYDCYGCINPEACNYDEDATMDGGGCIMPGTACDDGWIFTFDDFLQDDCSCNGYGCSDPEACNYASTALPDDDLCNYISNYGITGPLASYNEMLVSYSYPNTTGSTYEWIITQGDVTDGEGTASVEVVWWGDFQGQLCVVETNSFGCSGDTSCINVNIINDVGEYNQHILSIYPNPARTTLNIKSVGENDVVMRDVMQREVWSGRFINSVEIDVNDFRRGMYFIEVQHQGVRWIEKVLVH